MEVNQYVKAIQQFQTLVEKRYDTLGGQLDTQLFLRDRKLLSVDNYLSPFVLNFYRVLRRLALKASSISHTSIEAGRQAMTDDQIKVVVSSIEKS